MGGLAGYNLRVSLLVCTAFFCARILQVLPADGPADEKNFVVYADWRVENGHGRRIYINRN